MKVEKKLVLNKYFLSLFGFKEVKDLQARFTHPVPVQEGYDSEGRSFFVQELRLLDGLKIDENTLLKYDENIKEYLEKINQLREDKIILKYFQYMAVLFTEIFLDKFTHSRQEFLYELNQFLQGYKREVTDISFDEFTEEDLNKIAYWMATGSGKTLIMHINFYQFMKYRPFNPENIILITPNEGLSKQHYEEATKSGIVCKLYDGNLTSLSELIGTEGLLIIEITKFVEEKKGEGVTIPVEAFEGKNLVFVDEGHKGQITEERKWKSLREAISSGGFTFEYSATFGQILGNEEILEEYSKSIIFNYSYKYFYFDGYGKDFYVFNVKSTGLSEGDYRNKVLVANLLSYYEQLRLFEESKNLAREYNLEKPLWIFVGTSVSGKGLNSDVLNIVKFLQKVIDEEEWLKTEIEEILNGRVLNRDGKDIFENKFHYLREHGYDIFDVYNIIFGGRGSFKIFEIKNAEGELGLKIGENDYYGVINIGDIGKFKKLLDKEGISVERDSISSSLFEKIKQENSPINILIGSKKFIEGWDTWRVSSMGLLNIGKSEGPQIIQLFGRGIRLKGKNLSLKRSGEPRVMPLETLNIYGIKADYLDKFLEAIQKEEIEYEIINIPIEVMEKERWENRLYKLTVDKSKKYESEVFSFLKETTYLSVKLDLRPKLKTFEGLEKIEETKAEERAKRIPEEITELLDWDNIYLKLNEFRIQKGYTNFIFDKATLRNYITSGNYKLLLEDKDLILNDFGKISEIENLVILILKKYLDQYYKQSFKSWEAKNVELTAIGVKDEDIPYEKGGYEIYVDKNKSRIIASIKKLISDIKKLMLDDARILPRVYFDKHLYVPLLLESDEIDRISPPGLVKSEKEFVINLKEYLRKNKDKKFLRDKEIFLLRNLSRTGVRFFILNNFYPDFILWIKNDKSQRIVFIDPKGLMHIRDLSHEKIQLHNEIKNLEKALNNPNVILDSYILSITPYDELIKGLTKPPKKEDYIKENVLFLEDENCFDYIFRNIDS
jgi:superfamily II DNA or RNA helicase